MQRLVQRRHILLVELQLGGGLVQVKTATAVERKYRLVLPPSFEGVEQESGSATHKLCCAQPEEEVGKQIGVDSDDQALLEKKKKKKKKEKVEFV